MKASRPFAAASAVLAASFTLAGCRARGAAQPPAKDEMKVEQTPVGSIYEEKGGVLYERPARTPSVSPSPAPAPALTPSPTGTPRHS